MKQESPTLIAGKLGWNGLRVSVQDIAEVRIERRFGVLQALLFSLAIALGVFYFLFGPGISHANSWGKIDWLGPMAVLGTIAFLIYTRFFDSRNLLILKKDQDSVKFGPLPNREASQLAQRLRASMK